MILTAPRATAAFLAAAIIPTATADVEQVTDLLPSNSVMVMHASNARQTMDRLNQTPLMSFMKGDEMQARMQEMMTELSQGLSQALEEDEVDPMTLMPTGAVAMSIFPAVDPDARMALPGLALAGDYGGEADRMWERLGTVLTSDDMAGGPVVEAIVVGGRNVWQITMPSSPERMNNMGGGMGGMMPDPEAMLEDAFGTMWLAREGSYIMLTSNEGALQRMFDVSDGVEVDRLAGRDDASLIADRVSGRDATFMLLMRDMPTLLSGVDQMGMLAVATPILQQYFGRITGMGVGMAVSGDNAMIEQRAFIALPDGKSGFTALMDSADATMEIPSFVPADASSYSQFTFEFDGLAPLIGRLGRTAAMMGAPIGDPAAIQQIEQVITQFTDTLGRRVHQLQVVQQPVDPATSYSITAVELTDLQGMDQFVSMFGAQAGLEGRDFVGQRIYSMDPAMMSMMMGGMPGAASEKIAVGLGGGHAMFGMEPAVETMLRSVGDAGGAALADDPRVQRAIEALGGADGLVGWGWSDTATVMKSTLAAQKQSMEEMMQMMGEMDPAMQQEMMAGMGPMAMMMDLDPEIFSTMLGDSIFAFRSVDNGFVFDSWLFAPESE